MQRGSSIVGFTETMIDESGFLRRIAVVDPHVERHHWSSHIRSNETELSHRPEPSLREAVRDRRAPRRGEYRVHVNQIEAAQRLSLH